MLHRVNYRAHHSAKYLRQQGFTLMEITFAILILSGSLVVLLGLQSSVVDRMIRDSERQQAMMIARNILAVLESSDIGPVVQDFEGSVQEVLESEGAADSEDTDLYESLERFRVRLLVTEWSPDISGLNIPIDTTGFMFRVEVEVNWGEGPRDNLKVVYFVPAENNE